MGISSAFRSSSSGLAATAKWAELTSSNIANASNEGYVKRKLVVQSSAEGGVLVTGIQREVTNNLDRLFREGVAGVARHELVAGQLDTYSFQLGNPDDSNSIAGQFSKLYSGFGLLSNSPEDAALQKNVLSSAQGLTDRLNSASNSLASTRAGIETGIEDDVDLANGFLMKISDLNQEITHERGDSARKAYLQDTRAAEIDSLAGLLNINTKNTSDGGVNIFTASGTSLVDSSTVFDISYDSSVGELQVDGVNVTPNVSGGRGFSDGKLAGWFDLKNEILPQMQLQLDEFSRALIVGFETADASLSTGQAGLFTDLGAAYDPLQLEGLAGRIRVNAAVDPEQGGEYWRIRDGVGATTEGAVSDSTQTLEFLKIFETAQSFDPAAGQGSSAELLDFVSGMVADQKLVQVNAKAKVAEFDGRRQAVQSARQSVLGVNLDAELQQLTTIEQAYAANAQVTKALTQMLDTLLAAV